MVEIRGPEEEVLFKIPFNTPAESPVNLVLKEGANLRPITLKRSTCDFLEELKGVLKSTTGAEGDLEVFCFLGEGYDMIPINTAIAVAQLTPQSIIEFKKK